MGLRARALDVRWTPASSRKGMALGLSFKWRCGARLRRDRRRAARRARRPRRDPARGRRGAAPRTIARYVGRDAGRSRARSSAVGWEAPLAGSNAFVVGGGRSASGAADPRERPAPRALAPVRVVPGERARRRLRRRRRHAWPARPGVVIGRTPTVAWGLTNAMLDDADLWSEDVDGTGTRLPRGRRVARPRGRDAGDPAPRARRPWCSACGARTAGPLLSDALPGRDGTGRSRCASCCTRRRATCRRSSARAARARPTTSSAAAEGYGSPAQNLIYATTRGEAGYLFLGRVPVARAGAAPGAAARRDASPRATGSARCRPTTLPRYRIGRDGVVVTANQPTVGPEFPHYLSHLYEPGYRAARIHELLAGRSGLAGRGPRRDPARREEPRGRGVPAGGAAAVRGRDPDRAAARPCRCSTVCSRRRATRAPTPSGPRSSTSPTSGSPRRSSRRALGDDLVHRWMACINLMDEPLLAGVHRPRGPVGEARGPRDDARRGARGGGAGPRRARAVDRRAVGRRPHAHAAARRWRRPRRSERRTRVGPVPDAAAGPTP